ncbi:MAG: hypothetical protein ABFD89_29545 [Bryobacteraceae bacterium]
MPEQLTIEDLGRRTKARYPGAYDDLSDAEMGRAVKRKYPGAYDDFVETGKSGGQQANTFANKHGITNPAARTGLDFLEGFGAGVLSSLHGAAKMDPLRATQNWIYRKMGLPEVPNPIPEELGQAPDSLAGKAGKFAEQTAEFIVPGGAVTKATKGARLLPRLAAEAGTSAAVAGAQTAGDPVAMGVAAGTAGVGAGAAAGLERRAARALTSERAGTEYLVEQGVPVSAGVRSGNRVVHGIQELIDTTPGGAIVKTKADAATIKQTRRLAAELADRTGVAPTTPQEAAERMAANLEGKATRFSGKAEASYGKFRKIEAKPSSLRSVQMGTEVPPEAAKQLDNLAQSLAQKPFAFLTESEQLAVRRMAQRIGIDVSPKPVMQQIAMPADLRPIKQTAISMLEKTKIWSGAERQASQGYSALKEIAAAPDFVPASVAEEYLGALKTMARAKSATRRDPSQGMAAFIVPKLQAEIDSAVARVGGGEALGALRAGRRATVVKKGVLEVADKLREEPVQAFGQVTYARDKGIKLLHQIAKESPKTPRTIGRAWLDDVIGQMEAKAEAGEAWLQNGTWFANQWRNLGTETRKMLFGASHAADLDKLFLGVEQLSKSTNPSKTKILGMITNLNRLGSVGYALAQPQLGVPALAAGPLLSMLMHTPVGMKALNRLIHVPANNPAALAAATSKIVSITEGRTSPLPKAAEAMPSPEFDLAAVQ